MPTACTELKVLNFTGKSNCIHNTEDHLSKSNVCKSLAIYLTTTVKTILKGKAIFKKFDKDLPPSHTPSCLPFSFKGKSY